MQEFKCDVAVIGGGPAGLAAATQSAKGGKKVLLIEREARLGGILKQCIHDGFGLLRFNQKLSGCEYAEREIDNFVNSGCKALTLTYVTTIQKTSYGFCVNFVNRSGIGSILAEKLILSTGCRERTSKQIGVHGTNPAGVITAGTAQYYINIMGKMPAKKCVILGSGDIGLIMARRLTIEGAEVEGVYEAKSTPGGLTRNLVQCLNDFNIPLHLSHTVSRVYGKNRLTAVEISEVDENMLIIEGTQRIVNCDSLILSVGLIPENEIARGLNVEIDSITKGPVVDQCFQTSVMGVYCCGNAVHVNDLADYVSESGEKAGLCASLPSVGRNLANVSHDGHLSYVVPQKIDFNALSDKEVFYFRVQRQFEASTLFVKNGDNVIYSRKYTHLKPPEMERIVLPSKLMNGDLHFELEVEE